MPAQAVHASPFVVEASLEPEVEPDPLQALAVRDSISQSEVVAQQARGHPEVALNDAPNPAANTVAMVPNGQTLTILEEQGDVGCGDYVKVKWQLIEGFARARNLKQKFEDA